MPFCPACLFEFVEGIKVCPDCGVELVEQLPPQQEADVKWTLLATFSDVVYAGMVREALENSGIRVVQKTDTLHSLFAIQSTALVGSFAMLYVDRAQSDQARAILRALTTETTTNENPLSVNESPDDLSTH